MQQSKDSMLLINRSCTHPSTPLISTKSLNSLLDTEVDKKAFGLYGVARGLIPWQGMFAIDYSCGVGFLPGLKKLVGGSSGSSTSKHFGLPFLAIVTSHTPHPKSAICLPVLEISDWPAISAGARCPSLWFRSVCSLECTPHILPVPRLTRVYPWPSTNFRISHLASEIRQIVLFAICESF